MKFLLFSGIAIAAIAASQDVYAQTTAASDSAPTNASASAPVATLSDVVVTAQRRSENLQHAAVAVSAVTGETLISAGVTKPSRYEPGINRTYQDLAEHYGFAVLPARVRKPRDKAS